MRFEAYNSHWLTAHGKTRQNDWLSLLHESDGPLLCLQMVSFFFQGPSNNKSVAPLKEGWCQSALLVQTTRRMTDRGSEMEQCLVTDKWWEEKKVRHCFGEVKRKTCFSLRFLGDIHLFKLLELLFLYWNLHLPILFYFIYLHLPHLSPTPFYHFVQAAG